MRPADRRGHDRAGMPPAKLGAGLLAHRHPQIHRHDRRRRARASCSSSAGGSTRAPRALGTRQRRRRRRPTRGGGARARGRDRRQRAARPGRQQARHPRRARRPGGARPRDRARADRAARGPASPRRTFARESARSPRSARRGGRGNSRPGQRLRCHPGMIEIEARLDEPQGRSDSITARGWSAVRRGRTSCSTESRSSCCARRTTWGLADHPRVREAAAEAAMRWGVSTGASRLACGTMTIHRRLEERLAEFEHREAALLFGSGFLANTGVVAALARRARSSSATSSATLDPRRVPPVGSRAVRLPTTATSSTSRGASGRPTGAARWSRPTACSRSTATSPRCAEVVEVAAPLPAAADGRRVPRHRRARPRGPRRRRRHRARGPRRRDRRHARQRARLLRRLRGMRPVDGPLPRQRGADAAVLGGAVAAGGGRRAGRARRAAAAPAAGRPAAGERLRASRRARRARASI